MLGVEVEFDGVSTIAHSSAVAGVVVTLFVTSVGRLERSDALLMVSASLSVDDSIVAGAIVLRTPALEVSDALLMVSASLSVDGSIVAETMVLRTPALEVCVFNSTLPFTIVEVPCVGTDVDNCERVF